MKGVNLEQNAQESDDLNQWRSVSPGEAALDDRGV